MKFLLISLLFFLISEQTIAQKLEFNYDAAGNQIRRAWVCINCSGQQQVSNHKISIQERQLIKEKDSELLKENEVVGWITASPNPVTENLKVKWQNIPDRSVMKLEIYAINGGKIFSEKYNDTTEETNISFINLPSAIYILLATYSNSQRETIKILKK